MSSEDRSFEVNKWNVGNSSQRSDVEFTLWHRFVKPTYTYSARLSHFVHCIMVQALRTADYDNRWKESKALEAARENALNALHKYDEAYEALTARLKKEKRRL